ncbi:MAG: icmW [Gammaproteobacteria bacterium]|jgi:intracellular multiplication protein IcmW|nr:icmW [Gammaproteobacteria bacterium]
MPDMSLKATHKFWNEYNDPSVYRVLTFMEGVETWTLDGDPTLEEALQKLGNVLDNIGAVDLKEEDRIIEVAAHIKATRNLFLLQTLDTAHPGAASKLLMYAEQNSRSQKDVAGLFLRRNIVFERLRLLSRIFSEERFAMVAKLFEEKE